MEKVTYRLGGMACPDCAQKTGLMLERQKGIEHVKVSFTTGKAKIEYNPAEITLEEIEKFINKTGYKILAKS